LLNTDTGGALFATLRTEVTKNITTNEDYANLIVVLTADPQSCNRPSPGIYGMAAGCVALGNYYDGSLTLHSTGYASQNATGTYFARLDKNDSYKAVVNEGTIVAVAGFVGMDIEGRLGVLSNMGAIAGNGLAIGVGSEGSIGT